MKSSRRAYQLPVRFPAEDAAHLDEMQEHLAQDKATILRWALRYFYQAAKDSQWQVNSRGEPMLKVPSHKQ